MFLPRESIGAGPRRTRPHPVAWDRLGETSHQHRPVPCHTAAQRVQMMWRLTASRSALCGQESPGCGPGESQALHSFAIGVHRNRRVQVNAPPPAGAAGPGSAPRLIQAPPNDRSGVLNGPAIPTRTCTLSAAMRAGLLTVRPHRVTRSGAATAVRHLAAGPKASGRLGTASGSLGFRPSGV
jgi:hypothetical protein